MNEVTIKRVSNGFILEVESEDDQGFLAKSSEVFEDGEGGQQDSFVKLVYSLAGKFGLGYDKYGTSNLSVSFNKKGHKVDHRDNFEIPRSVTDQNKYNSFEFHISDGPIRLSDETSEGEHPINFIPGTR